MNSYSTRKSRTPGVAKAFLVSVMLHLVVAMLWIAALAMEIFSVQATDLVQEVKPEPEAFVQITEEMKALLTEAPQLVDQPEEEPATPQRSFQSTSENQETAEKVESARYFGERNTQAASELAGVAEGLEVPTQDGREKRSPNDLELLETQFADSELEGAPGRPGEPSPAADAVAAVEPIEAVEPKEANEANEAEPNLEELSDLAQETPPVEETPIFESEIEEPRELAEAEARELLSLEESIPVPKEEERPEPEIAAEEEAIPEPVQKPLEEAEEQVEEQVAQKAQEAEEAATASAGQRGLNNGFEREANRTRIQGTIRRVGASSVDVEDTVKGRFLAQVNKQIEREWQRQCILRREHILPGVLSISFVMDSSGGVDSFRFDSRIAGGAIQEGFTMLAVQKADLPAMPEEMQSELGGRDLEMSLTFFF